MARPTESPVPPRVSAPDLPPELTASEPGRRADLLAARLHLVGSADLAHASLEQCAITVDAEAVDLTGATLLDVAIDGVRVASLSLRNTTVRRLRISGGRIGTLDLSGARVAELELRDLHIDYLNLSATRGEDVSTADSMIRSLDMPRAELTRIAFSNCRSDEVDPRGMRAVDVDLRGLDALSFLDAGSLRGTTLTPFQIQQLAPTLAAGIGIRIRD